MKSLYVVHTQYNLILASGLASSEDDLILFTDFKLTDELKNKLESIFCRCLFLEGAFPKKGYSNYQKLLKIDKDIKCIKEFIKYPYSSVFIVEDMCIQEMYVLKCTYSFNKKIDIACLEDGAIAYFDNGAVSTGMGSTPFRRFIRKGVFSLRYGLFRFYDLASCTGGHKRINTFYAIFPDCIRDELKSKTVVEITQTQLMKGMRFMYDDSSFVFAENSILIAMDKLSVYGSKINLVNNIIEKVIEEALDKKQKVYYKYHPRETDTLHALRSGIEIDRNIALESYLINSTTQLLTIIGIKSTSLQIAKKLGYGSISYIRSLENAQDIIGFYSKIGVECR